METFPHKKWNWFEQLDLHAGIFLVAELPVEGVAFHYGIGNLCLPSLGFGENKNNGGNILADSEEIVSRGHEPGERIMPHWNLFPFLPVEPNIFIPLLIHDSSSTCEFAAGAVRGPDGPIAVSIFKWTGRNLACNDPCPLPTCIVYNHGTVIIGITLADVIAGLMHMFVDSAVEWLKSKLLELPSKYLAAKGLFKSQMLSFLGENEFSKIFRDSSGRFASMSEELVQSAFEHIFGDVYDFASDKSGLSEAKDSLEDSAIDASADAVSNWLGGRAEPLH